MARRRRNAEQLRRRHEEFRRPLEKLFGENYRLQMRQLKAASEQEAEPFNAAQWSKKVAEAMRPTYRRIMNASGRRYLLDLAPFVPTKAARFLKQGPRQRAGEVLVGLEASFAERLAKTIETTWRDLSQIVLEAETQGLGDVVIDQLLAEQWERVFGTRTETIVVGEVTGAINGVSDYLARELIELNDWITAGDERVRATHRVYGGADPRPPGFNWADLTGGNYILRYPADPQCTEVAEVANCRCFLAPSVTSEPGAELFDEVAQQFVQL